MSPSRIALICLALSSGSLVGCGGGFQSLGSATGTSSNGDPSGNPNSPNSPSEPGLVEMACTPGSARGSQKPGVIRLTLPELEASLATVLPATKSAMQNNWVNLFRTFQDTIELHDVRNYDPFLSESQLDSWLNIADQIGSSASTSDLDSCLSVTSPAQTCYRQTIANWVKKVWRRPLATSEIDSLYSRISGLSKSESINRLVSIALVSPHFMYRVESSDQVEGGRVRIDPFSVASRISYATIGSGPDTTLLAAAERGELSSIAQVEAHVRRLLATAQAKKHFEVFVRSWLRFGKLSSSAADYPVVSGGLSPNELTVEATTRETLDYVFHVVWKENGSFKDLMSRPISLARNASIAKIYGSSANPTTSTDPVAYPAPNHPGLSLRAAFLMSGTQYSSPIRRGVFVLQRLLCKDIPLPTAEILAQRDTAPESIDPISMPNYQVANASTSGSTCLACHSMINPVGFTMENFDALGRPQTKQNVINLSTGSVLATHNLPGPSTTPVTIGNSNVFSSGQELALALSQSGQARSCLNRQYFRFTEKRMERDTDGCRINESYKVLDENLPILESMTRSIASEDIFYRGPN